MAASTLDRAAVLDRLVEDAGVDRATRCALYRRVFGEIPGWGSEAEYAALPPDGCTGEPPLR